MSGTKTAKYLFAYHMRGRPFCWETISLKKEAADVFISHSLVRDTKQYDAARANFKQVIASLIDSGHKVAAFEDSTKQPSVIFKDSDSFLYWYENFYRLQGWFIQQ